MFSIETLECRQRVAKRTFEEEAAKFAKNPSAYAWTALKLAMYRHQEAFFGRPERVLADVPDAELLK